MIKTVEYNDGESRLQGHVEVLPSEEIKGAYVITSYVEDKVFGMPWKNVTPDKIKHISQISENGVLKELKKMAEGYKAKSVFDILKDKGYDAL